AESARRQEIAARILRGFIVAAHPQGHHLWLTLPPAWRQRDLSGHARLAGLALVPSDVLAVSALPDAVRISLGVAGSRDELERGLGILAAVLSDQRQAVAAVV